MFDSIGSIVCIPFAWLVRLFYNMTNSYGMAIILFTLVIKIIMLPFQLKSKKSMIRMSRMSNKVTEIQKKYSNNQMKMNEEIQKLYAEEGISPMSGCLWSFVPLPILLCLYSIIRRPITHFMMISEETTEKLLQSFIARGGDLAGIVNMKDGIPVVSKGLTQFTAYGQINLVKAISENFTDLVAGIENWINVNYNFAGLDLAETPWNSVTHFAPTWAVIGMILIPILAGASQLVMSVIMMKQNPQSGAAAGSTKGMMYMMPLFSVYIAFLMPGALGVYWIAQSLFMLIQEVVLNKFFNQKIEAEEQARYEARQKDRQLRME